MNYTKNMRYERQVMFNKIGKEKQKLIEDSTITIIGLGALGSVISEMLVRSGVKNLIIIDRDIIELTNLQRQSLYCEEDIGKLKALVAKEKLEKINSEVKIKSYSEDLDYNNIEIIKSDLILDCTDNLDTRFLINDYSKSKKIPWIYAAVIGGKGMVLPVNINNPCFSCIFKETDQIIGTCETEGILNSTVHAIAGIQFNEAIKILTKNKKTSVQLIYFNLWDLELKKINVNKNDKCETCNGNYKWLKGYGDKPVLKLCGSNKFQIKLNPINLEELDKKLNEEKLLTKHCLMLKDMTVFKNGRVLVKAETKQIAKSLIDKYLK